MLFSQKRTRGAYLSQSPESVVGTTQFVLPIVNPVKLPIRSPNLNTYAERFIRSAKWECIGQVIPLGRRPLRRVVGEYVEHYHRERNHQGLGNRLIERSAGGLGRSVPVECHERLGGMLRYYARAA